MESFAQKALNVLGKMQADWPLPEEGKRALARDLEYTNKKRGLGLKAEWLNVSTNDELDGVKYKTTQTGEVVRVPR